MDTYLAGVVVAFTLASALNIHVAIGLKTDPSEVSALRAVRSRLIDTMNYLHTWEDGDPCASNWRGIFCNTSPDDGFQHIIELQLFKMNLSGTLAPEIGLLSHLQILDFMWNHINGSIPKEIGNITPLRLILLNGNQLSGSLPEEIGNLMHLNRLQVDLNSLSGPIPKSFGNLRSVKHLHMNNNSLSGPIPVELSNLPILFHLLLDNNNLSGNLAPELGKTPNLKIFQVDNNNFSGSSIPVSYGNISTLLKLSLRNCSLQGNIPDLSGIPHLAYLDLSWNQLTGSIPSNKLSTNVTTIDLSYNLLEGTIPSNLSGLPKLQLLSVRHNYLNGSVPSEIWDRVILTGNKNLTLDFQNNYLTTLPTPFDPPPNVIVMLFGNPACSAVKNKSFCQLQFVQLTSGHLATSVESCFTCSQDNYEYSPFSPISCLCAAPVGIGFRLKSPGITDFVPYIRDFEMDLTTLLNMSLYQLYIEQYIWESSRRLNMHLKLFPNNISLFSISDVIRLRRVISGWEITLSDVFGPYELLNFTADSYMNELPKSSGLSTSEIVGISIGAVAGTIVLSILVTLLIVRKIYKYHKLSKASSSSKHSVRTEGVRMFTFEEMVACTNNFSESHLVGEGGYGKVYKGILADKTVVAIKRAHGDSLQGSTEFCTEIELLSRLHHRNLVSLVGYCDEVNEQMLVYEFIPNGTLRDHLSEKSREPLDFATRLQIALGSAKGILYLHTEANPPIYHRDVKASNILLDSKFVAKVADFGLSKLAPVRDVGESNLPGYVSTVVKGTPGYLDPEYFQTHQLTDKSDVYSLGVVFLELLTGMKPIVHGKNIVREVKMAYQKGIIVALMDSRMGLYPAECAEKFASLALSCVEDDPGLRPSMHTVVRELQAIGRMIPEAEIIVMPESSKLDGDETVSESTTQPFVSSDASSSGFFISSFTPR